MAMTGMTDGEKRVIAGVLALPLGSAADIARVQDRTPSGVHARLRALRDQGLVDSVVLGCLLPPVERFFLTERALGEMGLGATWHQPGSLIRLLERLTSVETLYQAAAGIRDLGELRDFQWMDAVAMDAGLRFQFGWVAVLWVGLLRSESSFEQRLEALGNDILALASNHAYPRPSRVCCVVWDLWQVELVLRVVKRYRMTGWVSILCIADGSWHGAASSQAGRGWVHQPVVPLRAGRSAWERRVKGSLWAGGDSLDAAAMVRRAMPAVRSGPGGEEAARLVRRAMRAIRSADGLGEAAAVLRSTATALEAGDPGSAAAGTVRRIAASLEAPVAAQDAARVLYAVAEWPGITTGMVRTVLGEGPSGRRAQNGCLQLTDLGLLLRWRDGARYRYRLSWQGMELLADLDRVSAKDVWDRIQMDRWEQRDGFKKHEYGVLDVMSKFVAAGCQVAAGWRDWEQMGDEGGIDPDAMVLLRKSPYGPGWHYLEYELSAREVSTISRKLRGYDSRRRPNRWPVMVAAATARAQANFHAVGESLRVPLLTVPIPTLRKTRAAEIMKCWSLYGVPVELG